LNRFARNGTFSLFLEVPTLADIRRENFPVVAPSVADCVEESALSRKIATS
jgi:hypothetical protein